MGITGCGSSLPGVTSGCTAGISNCIPEAMGGTPITATTLVAAALVAIGACAAATFISRMNIGPFSTPIGTACAAACCYGAYIFYNYGYHTSAHTAADNAYNAGATHPYLYGAAVAAGVGASLLGTGGDYY